MNRKIIIIGGPNIWGGSWGRARKHFLLYSGEVRCTGRSFHGGKSRRRTLGGLHTAMSLPIAKELIEMCGGKIWKEKPDVKLLSWSLEAN
ncbi:MAG: hypothetical protein ACYS6W_15200 [Planctomycetota bacterium]|jgi:hypothetical protein